MMGLFIPLIGCNSPSLDPNSTSSNAGRPVKTGNVATPEHCVSYVMRNDQPLLVIWSDALPPDAAANAGEIPADEILKSLNQDFLPQKVVLKARSYDNPQSPADPDYNRVVTFAIDDATNSVQLVWVDYGERVTTNVFDLANGALFVVSVKKDGLRQLNHDVNELKFEPDALAAYCKAHPEIGDFFSAAAK
jgi:hypothetical protein